MMLAQQQQSSVAEFNVRNWALQKICGAGVKRIYATFAILTRGNDNCWNMRAGCPCAYLADEFRAVHFRHAVVDYQ